MDSYSQMPDLAPDLRTSISPEEQEILEQQQADSQQIRQAQEQLEPVDNVQEAVNVLPDAVKSIGQDVVNFGAATPRWVDEEDDGAPELKTTWGKTLSDIFQMVIPLVLIGATRGKAIRALRNRGMLKSITQGGKLDRFANFAFDAGAETAWLQISRQGEQDNLTGQLAELGVPMPEFLATNDKDDPEAKRVKQQLEAVGLGIFGSLVAGLFRFGAGRFMSRVRGNDAASKEYVEQIAKKGGESDPVTSVGDQVIRDEGLRESSDSEMALKRFADNGGQIPDPWTQDPDNYIQSGLFDTSERIPKAVPAEGLIEAVTDNYKIQSRPGGNGRMQRFMTDAALDAISEGDLEKRTLIRGVEQQLADFNAQNLDIDVGGRWKNNKEIMASMDGLVAGMFGIPKDELKRLLPTDTVTVADGKKIEILNPLSSGAAIKLSKRYLDEFSAGNMKASALVQTSVANDISDSAVTSNLIADQIDVTRTQDRMLDLIEFLTYEQTLSGSYYGWALQARKVGLGLTDDQVNLWKATAAEEASKIRQLAADVKKLRSTNPRMADVVTEAYELTDGSIKDVKMLTQAIRDSVKGRRVAKNWGYASPALLVEGISSLFYAFKLSSLYTPIKASMNNVANFIMKPLTEVIGGADGRRAWAQYVNGSTQYTRITAQLMSERYKQVQSLPVTELARADYKDRIMQQQQWLDIAQKYADESGDLGLQMKVNFANTMIAMGNHKFLRYSTNMMEASDAALNVGLVLTDKRGQMIDEIMARAGKITDKDYADIDKWMEQNGATYARGALDSDWKPIDTSLRFQGGEIAMNLDGSSTQGLNQALNKIPILKTFVMFPKTALNSLSFFQKHSPVSGDLYRIATLKEPPEIEAFLRTKGITYSEENWMRFKQQTRGRVILGTTVMGYAWGMWANGNITGNGPYDRTTNRMNKDAAQQPVRSWRAWEGAPWISYDGIEPISSLISLTVDLADNYDTLGKATFEDLSTKVGRIFADNITNKSFISGLRPLFDAASGRPGALENYFANLASISFVTHLGRTIDPAYRAVENDFMSQLQNKYTIFDSLGITDPLPYDYNIVTGQKVSPQDFLGSSLVPVKISKNQTKAQEILSEIEFPVNAAIRSAFGVELTEAQISRVKQIIGTRGRFAKEIVRIYNSQRAQDELKNIRERRKRGVTSEQYDYSNSFLISRITEVLGQEIGTAKKMLRNEDPTILEQMNNAYRLDRATKSSNFERIDELLGIN